jgi:transposase
MLTEEKRVEIRTYRAAGKSIREICRLTKVSDQTVQNVLKNKPRKIRRTPPRPKLITPRVQQKIKGAISRRLQKNQLVNNTILKKSLGLKCSTRTIQRHLKESNILYMKVKKQLGLSDEHKAARVIFARRHLKERTDFLKWIFTDEKKFNLDGPDNMRSYILPGEPNPVRIRRQNGGGSVMIFGALASNGNLLIKVSVTAIFGHMM